MKISKLFHYLYAAIMFLPLLLLPVFMIYSHRHTIDSGSIEVPQNQVVDFNQLYTGKNEVNNQYGITITFENYYIAFEGTSTIEGNFITLFYFPVKENHIYYLRDFAGGSNNDYNFYGIYGNSEAISPENGNFTFTSDYNNDFYFRIILSRSGLLSYDMGFYFNVYDLTQMFGSGNEPTIQQFNQWYPNDYYSYTLSHKEILEGTSTITYNDTDIMSQATYQLYNAFENYFNMRKVFNLNGLYLWFSMTFFNGASPVAFVIIFNLFIYWLFVSLLWLLFDFFMYIPLVIHNGIDKARIE